MPRGVHRAVWADGRADSMRSGGMESPPLTTPYPSAPLPRAVCAGLRPGWWVSGVAVNSEHVNKVRWHGPRRGNDGAGWSSGLLPESEQAVAGPCRLGSIYSSNGARVPGVRCIGIPHPAEPGDIDAQCWMRPVQGCGFW